MRLLTAISGRSWFEIRVMLIKFRLMYHHGRGVPQDKATAVKWYRRAAQLGAVSAQYYLATAVRSLVFLLIHGPIYECVCVCVCVCVCLCVCVYVCMYVCGIFMRDNIKKKESGKGRWQGEEDG